MITKQNINTNPQLPQQNIFDILVDIATKSLDEEENKENYVIQPHQKNLTQGSYFKKYPLLDKTGVTETMTNIIDLYVDDLTLYEKKKSDYGDSVAAYTPNAMLDQTLFKVVAAITAHGMGNITTLYGLMVEVRLYAAMIYRQNPVVYTYEQAVSILPYKELNYASAWKLGSIETLLSIIKSKLIRHQGKMVGDDIKAFSDFLDVMNYTAYIQLKIQEKSLTKLERQEDEK